MKPHRSPATDFGLLAWLEETRIALPLKGVECRLEVTGPIACVELDQIFHQNAASAVDCTYSFPLPEGAAVYRCEVHINGRVIRARVVEAREAQRIFRTEKARGRRAALVQTVRGNLFTLSLGNMQPEDVIVVRLAWFQELERVGDQLRLRVPTCPGVRYIPGQPLLRSSAGAGTADDTDEVPDASCLTPPRIDALHPDAAYFAMAGRLSAADVRGGTLSSPTHAILVREAHGTVKVELSSQASVPDRDLVIAWDEPAAQPLAPLSWHWEGDRATYALIQLRAPTDVPEAANFPQDFYFLVDRSGSMEGLKWSRTCEALRAFVALLGAEDRVWMTFFESTHADFAEAPLPVAEVRSDPRFRDLHALGTAGGTELRPAAEHVLGKIREHSAGRRTTVVLITDGQVGNDDAILKAFQRQPEIEVHTFGIDTAVNDAFLKALARQHGGDCWLQTPNDDIAGTVAALGQRLRRPVVTDLEIRGAWETGRRLRPALYAGQVVCVALRSEQPHPIAIAGRLPDGREYRFESTASAGGGQAIELLWARQRIASLLEERRAPEAIALAIAHNLICEGASFVAWDEAEQVQIAAVQLVQPALEQAHLHYSLSEAAAPAESPGGGIFGIRKLAQSERIDPDVILRAAVDHAVAAMRNAGLPASTQTKLIEWAQDGNLHRRRTPISAWHSVFAGVEAIQWFQASLPTPEHRATAEEKVAEALDAPPEKLGRMLDLLRKLRVVLCDLQLRLLRAAAAGEAGLRLTTWLLEADLADGHRLAIAESFFKTLDRLPRKAGMTARAEHWRTFLESSIGPEAVASPVIAAWLAEMAGLAEGQFNRENEKLSPDRFRHAAAPHGS